MARKLEHRYVIGDKPVIELLDREKYNRFIYLIHYAKMDAHEAYHEALHYTKSSTRNVPSKYVKRKINNVNAYDVLDKQSYNRYMYYIHDRHLSEEEALKKVLHPYKDISPKSYSRAFPKYTINGKALRSILTENAYGCFRTYISYYKLSPQEAYERVRTRKKESIFIDGTDNNSEEAKNIKITIDGDNTKFNNVKSEPTYNSKNRIKYRVNGVPVKRLLNERHYKWFINLLRTHKCTKPEEAYKMILDRIEGAKKPQQEVVHKNKILRHYFDGKPLAKVLNKRAYWRFGNYYKNMEGIRDPYKAFEMLLKNSRTSVFKDCRDNNSEEASVKHFYSKGFEPQNELPELGLDFDDTGFKDIEVKKVNDEKPIEHYLTKEEKELPVENKDNSNITKITEEFTISFKHNILANGEGKRMNQSFTGTVLNKMFDALKEIFEYNINEKDFGRISGANKL